MRFLQQATQHIRIRHIGVWIHPLQRQNTVHMQRMQCQIRKRYTKHEGMLHVSKKVIEPNRKKRASERAGALPLAFYSDYLVTTILNVSALEPAVIRQMYTPAGTCAPDASVPFQSSDWLPSWYLVPLASFDTTLPDAS
jgi:hypothetical protein